MANLPQPSAEPSTKIDAQQKRLDELAIASNEGIQRVIDTVKGRIVLPQLVQHFGRHRADFATLDVSDAEGYLELLKTHLSRDDLRLFTYITTQPTRDRMWIFVAIDSGVVALYNETKKRIWSFFRHYSAHEYMASGRGWWVDVVEGENGEFQVRAW